MEKAALLAPQPIPAQIPVALAAATALLPKAAEAKKPSRKYGNLVWLGMVLAAVSAVVWLFGIPWLLGPVVPEMPLVRADFVQTLVASGHIETPFRVSVGSQITGVVASVPVAEGATVIAGESLVVLVDTEARAAVVQAQGQLAEANARVHQIVELTLPTAKQTLAQTQATVLAAQQTYDRTATLASNGNATRASLDDATRALDVARTQVRNAQLAVFTNTEGGSDFVLAQTQVAQMSAAVAAAQSRLGYTQIKAPRDGILIARAVEAGDVVQPGKELFSLSPKGAVQIVVQIDEKNLGLIALGQSALASADAYPRQTFAAKIIFINPGVDLQRASVQVKLAVPELPDYVRQDMTISVDIEVARHPAALIIPAADIHDMATAKPWVLKAEAGKARRKTVAVGLVSAGKAEILSGLAEGDTVIPSASGGSDGRHIRLQAAKP